jgi:hypothetical protein
MTGGPREYGTRGLSEEDVKALFELMATVVSSADDREDLMFTGEFLAAMFRAYSDHFVELMRDWPELSDALQSQDSIRKAKRFHERLRQSSGIRPLVDTRGRSLRVVPDEQAQITRSLIAGKGMEIWAVGIPSTDQKLPDYDDVGYVEPPKSTALYVDATKWIVGLATGSFLLTSQIFSNRPDELALKCVSGLAILLMALAVVWGVRALQFYIRLANQIEVNAVRKPFEVAERNDGYQMVRWATRERVERVENIKISLKKANLAYLWMTWTFGPGVAVYLLYIILYFGNGGGDPVGAKFVATSTPGSPILGVVHDRASASDCLVVRTASGVECRAVPTSR